MDEPCDTCGDVGVSNVIARCSRCKIACEHIYCMKKLRLELPVDWICEACETGSLISPKDAKENLLNLNTSHVVEPSASRSKSGKNVKTSKVQYITPGEVVKLASGAKKFESPTKCSVLSRPGPSKNVPSTSARFSIKPKGAKAAPLKFLPLAVIEKSCSRTAGQLLQRHNSSAINLSLNQPQVQASRDTREKRTDQVPGKYLHKGHNTATLKQLLQKEPKDTVIPMEQNSTEEEVVADRRLCAALMAPLSNEGCKELKNSDANKGALVKILPEAERYFPIPALDASWNGSFEILDNVCSKFNGGLRAHPPARVLRKVHEFSKKMPHVLQFRMFTRYNVWKDIFPGDCPDANDIGLYFFSNNHKLENYSFLMDFIEKQNLVLSCHIDGVELLVFSSRLLSAEAQRWSGQYFLWGVFRRVKKSTVKCSDDEKKLAIIPQPLEVTNEENTIGDCTGDEKKLAIIPQPSELANAEETNGDEDGAIDMDIDMEGGKIVGKVDIPILRESSNWTHGTSTQQEKKISTPPPKKVSFKLCSPPPGFGLRIRSNPPMVKPLQVDKTLASLAKPSRISFGHTPVKEEPRRP